LGVSIALASVSTEDCSQIVRQCLVIAKCAFEEHRTLLEALKESASFVVIVCQRHTIGAIHIDRCIATVLLENLDIADFMTLTMDGETQT
jgi:hypothetical protein